MLILTRRVGECVVIGEEVTVTVLGVKGNQVRIGINAGSLAPARACQSIPCNSTVKWRIEWGPKAAPAANGAVSKAGPMQCVY